MKLHARDAANAAVHRAPGTGASAPVAERRPLEAKGSARRGRRPRLGEAPLLNLNQTTDVTREAALALAIKSLEGRDLNGAAAEAGPAIETLRRMLEVVGAGDLLPPEMAEEDEQDLPQIWGRAMREKREAAVDRRSGVIR